MYSRAASLLTLHFRQFFRKGGWWPFVLACVYGVIVSRVELSGDSWANAIEHCYWCCAALALFLALQIGREEIDQHSIVRFRTFPVSYVEDYLARCVMLSIYVLLVMLSGFLSIHTSSLLFHSESPFTREVNLFVYEGIEIERKAEGWNIHLKEALGENEELYLNSRFIESDGRESDQSSVLVEVASYQDDIMERSQITLLAKRKVMLSQSQGVHKLVLPLKGNSNGIEFDIVFKNPRRLITGLSGFQSSCHLLSAFAIQIFIFTLFFVALSKRLSVEVALFVIIGLLSIRYLMEMMGFDFFSSIQYALDKQASTLRQRQEMWWEESLAYWSGLMSLVSGYMESFSFPDYFSQLKSSLYIRNPFLLAESLKSYALTLLLVVFLIPLSWKREA
ncbi:MAG: hypothetical protein HQL32_03290 [Planctomycetes bacterium]|nr:hypothetical protein [Planctomycetota bacterium]